MTTATGIPVRLQPEQWAALAAMLKRGEAVVNRNKTRADQLREQEQCHKMRMVVLQCQASGGAMVRTWEQWATFQQVGFRLCSSGAETESLIAITKQIGSDPESRRGVASGSDDSDMEADH
jgi:hypothetical protein